VVRTARAGERVTTLDGVERAMTTDDCLICDSDGAPVGIAGVMGGAAAEISSDTSELLLETAYFDAAAIARTSGRVALRTEASMRFERGVDPEGLARAAARFCALAAEVAGAEVRGGLADVRGRLPKRPRPLVRTARLNQILGTSLDADDVAALLAPIGFESVPGRGGVRVTVPTWRPDCTQEVDVVEEVARLYGYARIPRTVPGTAHVGGLDARQQFRRRLRDVLRGAGASEAWTTTFLAPDDIERAGLTVESVEVENPLVHEESRLRPSLLPGMLRAVSVNAAFRNPDVSLFEIGNVFTPAADAGVPVETERAAVALAGDDALAAGRLWRLIADALSLSGLRLERGVAEGLHPARTFVVYDGDAVAGVAGEVAPEVLAAYDIDGRVAWIDIAVEALRGAVDADRAYVPVSRFPSSDVDLAFVVADDVPAARVEETLRAAGGELLVDIRLFDVYRGERLGQGRRSLAYRLRFNAADHTLTDAEVGGLRQRCIDAVESSWPAHLRS
jgi:phenylalanyl-tRNA synthetase beta chain